MKLIGIEIENVQYFSPSQCTSPLMSQTKVCVDPLEANAKGSLAQPKLAFNPSQQIVLAQQLGKERTFVTKNDVLDPYLQGLRIV